jgi:hypothetical protein
MASAPPSPPQLTPENLNELQLARQRLKGIRRAVSAGRFEGYSIAICGGLSFLAGIGSLTSMAGGALLLGVGIVEVYMVGQLRKLDLRAPRFLAANQLVLAALIVLYACWSLHSSGSSSSADTTGMSASDVQAMNQMIGPVNEIAHSVSVLLFGSLLIAAVFEGGMAWYYYSKAEPLREYLAETPEWILQMQRAGVSV